MKAFNEAVFGCARDAIRCFARADECLIYVAFMQRRDGKERVQLETKYSRSNQIAYRNPNKIL